MLTDKISKIDLISTLEGYGIELSRQRTGRYVGICPLHADSNPSFYVFTDGPKHRFNCFGCGAHGDAVDFVRGYHGCDTKEALRRLEIKSNIDPQQKRDLEKKRQGVQQFDHWRRLIIAALTELKSMAETSTLEQVIRYPCVIDAVQKWRYWVDILAAGTDQEQIEFYFAYREKLKPLYQAMVEREKQPRQWACSTVEGIRIGGLINVRG